MRNGNPKGEPNSSHKRGSLPPECNKFILRPQRSGYGGNSSYSSWQINIFFCEQATLHLGIILLLTNGPVGLMSMTIVIAAPGVDIIQMKEGISSIIIRKDFELFMVSCYNFY